MESKNKEREDHDSTATRTKKRRMGALQTMHRSTGTNRQRGNKADVYTCRPVVYSSTTTKSTTQTTHTPRLSHSPQCRTHTPLLHVPTVLARTRPREIDTSLPISAQCSHLLHARPHRRSVQKTGDFSQGTHRLRWYDSETDAMRSATCGGSWVGKLIRENIAEDGWIDTDQIQEEPNWSERNVRRRSKPEEGTEHQTALRS